MNDRFAAGQRRIAILGGQAVKVRLVRPTPDNTAWTCAVEADAEDEDAEDEYVRATGTMFLIPAADLRELVPDAEQ